MVTEIAGVIWEGLKVTLGWVLGYTKPATTEARVISDENKKKDEFSEALNAGTEEGLNEVRKRLPND